MATTVDTLLVRIEADLSDLRKDMRKATAQVDSSAKKMSKSFSAIGKAAGAAFAAVVVAQAGKAAISMVKLAADIEEMQDKSLAVFKEFREGVVSDLEAFGNAVGRSTHSLEGMAASLQDIFVPLGFARLIQQYSL